LAEAAAPVEFIPRPVERAGTGCPEYDRWIGLLFAGVDFLGGRKADKPRRLKRIEPDWADTCWRARLRLR